MVHPVEDAENKGRVTENLSNMGQITEDLIARTGRHVNGDWERTLTPVEVVATDMTESLEIQFCSGTTGPLMKKNCS